MRTKKANSRKRVIFVVKDKVTTTFAQHADLFEAFKFVGTTVAGTAAFTVPVGEALRRLSEAPDEKRQVVGIIVPDEEAVFLPGHEVMSDGTNWWLVADMAKAYGCEGVRELQGAK